MQMQYRYLLFYKPYNVLCQFTNPDNLDCLTLKDFIEVPQVYSVGRLDRDSEGLLLLTDHGALKHRLSHPKFQHPRTYWVQVERKPDETALTQLRQGVTIKGGYRTLPAQVSALNPEPLLPPRDPPIRFRKTVPTAWLSLTLIEGRNRQVRRMTAAVGHPTLRLVRAAMGAPSSSLFPTSPTTTLEKNCELTLAGLQPGQWRDLTLDEVNCLPSLWERLSSGASPLPNRSNQCVGDRPQRNSSKRNRKSKYSRKTAPRPQRNPNRP